MADLPSAEHNDLFNCEIYDESRHPPDGLIWLSSDEEALTLAETAKSFETRPLVCRPLYVTAAIASEGPAEDTSVNPVSEGRSFSDIAALLLPPKSSDGDSSAGVLFGSLLLSHKTYGQFSLTRRLFRVAALVGVLLIGSVLPSIIGHLRPSRVKASAAVAGRSAAAQSAGHAMSKPVRVLTVMAGRQETVKDISIRYVGHFDSDVFEEIRKLNPDLKDPDHLKDGQLIRIPLRAGTMFN